MLDITVRSRVKKANGDWYTAWLERCHSWKKAWSIVDNCGAERSECHKWSTPKKLAHFIDIDGAQERKENDAALAALLNVK